MNIIDCRDLELFDLRHFVEFHNHPYGYVVSDSHQPNKYYHNFLMILSPLPSSAPLLDYFRVHVANGFVIYRLEESAGSVDFSFLPTAPQIENNGYYVASLQQLRIPYPKSASALKVLRVNETLHHDFYRFLFESNREYGDSFARELVNRIVPLLVDDCPYHYYVVQDGAELIAMVRLFYRNHQAGIDDFYVIPSRRGQGIGSYLFHTVLASLPQQGIQQVYLVADEDDTPKKMYERFGFRRVGTFQMVIWKA